jgi:hypothetical protein
LLERHTSDSPRERRARDRCVGSAGRGRRADRISSARHPVRRRRGERHGARHRARRAADAARSGQRQRPAAVQAPLRPSRGLLALGTGARGTARHGRRPRVSSVGHHGHHVRPHARPPRTHRAPASAPRFAADESLLLATRGQGQASRTDRPRVRADARPARRRRCGRRALGRRRDAGASHAGIPIHERRARHRGRANRRLHVFSYGDERLVGDRPVESPPAVRPTDR